MYPEAPSASISADSDATSGFNFSGMQETKRQIEWHDNFQRRLLHFFAILLSYITFFGIKSNIRILHSTILWMSTGHYS